MDLAFVSNVVYPFVTGGAEERIHEIGTRLADEGQIAVSGITADRLAEIGTPREKIDVEQIQNAPLPETSYCRDDAPDFDILFAGRLIKDKRVDVLLDAFDRVAARHDVTALSGSTHRLVLCGAKEHDSTTMIG
jgi:glycosyltransferase involved in cell wall biosynthesis